MESGDVAWVLDFAVAITPAAGYVTSMPAIVIGVAIIWSGVITTGLLLALKATIGIRVSEEVEESGIDAAEHAETGYNLGEVTMGRS